MNRVYRDTIESKLWSKFPELFESDNSVLKFLKQGEGTEEHVFAAAASEGLNEVNDTLSRTHNDQYR